MAAILNCAILDSAILHRKELHSFILTELDDGSHLEFCHVGFEHCHLRFKHLVIFSQIHSKTLFLHSDSDSNLFNLINLMMATILNSSILNSGILDSAILHKTLTQTSSISLKLLHSLLMWWCQSSCILPSCILPSWIQPFCSKLWLQLIQSDWNSFIFTQLDDGSHPELCHVGFIHCHLGFRHLVIFSQIHSKTLSLHSDSDPN